MKAYRIFVEKKEEFKTEANYLLKTLSEDLLINIDTLRIINIYDVFNIEEELLEKAKYQVFAQLEVDNIYDEFELSNLNYFAIEYLPGQFDQRADSAQQCIKLLDNLSDVVIRCGKMIITDDQTNLLKIKKYLLNPVEAREKDLSILRIEENIISEEVTIINEFQKCDLNELKQEFGLAMSLADLTEIRNYFNSQKRNPTQTELKMLDAYWSDHCRHTTFETILEVDIQDKAVLKSFNKYLSMKEKLNRQAKPLTLMDLATINAKYEYMQGNLNDLEISEENNACSIYVDVDKNDNKEKYILMFKNETHNHPTEIEPFGGASTCVGGIIRDPLSGRSQVYQAMRITGAGDITSSVASTREGKLPQRVISRIAALGNSTYSNQIGAATTFAKEIFHQGFIAKRMELGAVVAAAPATHIVRKKPIPGDFVLLLGGKTGRDGIGGASGSSVESTNISYERASAEVQKGNASIQRNIIRLYNRIEASRLIKKSNDFGAGGVSVAIGELADSLEIYLDKVPLKYPGLNASEIALSESQERMAVVIGKEDIEEFFRYAKEEDVEATIVAIVTDTKRLVMKYHQQIIVDIKREFLNTNGAKQYAKAKIEEILFPQTKKQNITKQNILQHLGSLNVCMQRGIQEMFDSTNGGGTVLMPLGGKYQLSETQVSVAKIPVKDGETKSCSILAYGYDPSLSSASPYHGAMYAVIEAMSKVVAAGGDYQKIRFSFQEFFEKTTDEIKWGKPLSALLGTIEILQSFSLASLGGKDSMSGTFKDVHVPPTLVAFAVNVANIDNIISNDFKKAGNKLYLIKHTALNKHMPDVNLLKKNFEFIQNEIKNKKIVSSFALTQGGLIEALVKSALGNDLGFKIKYDDLFTIDYGCILIETIEEITYPHAIHLGEVTSNDYVINDLLLNNKEALHALESTISSIFPIKGLTHNMNMEIVKKNTTKTLPLGNKKEVKVFIPIFNGTNNEYDVCRAFKDAGGNTELWIFKSNDPQEIKNSIKEMVKKIEQCDILALSGAAALGDEPDGSAKSISIILNNSEVKNAINNLIARKGLVLGINNGFQGLLSAGYFSEQGETPALIRNDINRYVSHIANCVVSSTKSPWLFSFEVDEVYQVPLSTLNGKLVVSEKQAKVWFDNGQVVFQYCDDLGQATMNSEYNLTGSYYAIEGLVSKDGLILGKMCHSERYQDNTLINIYGNKKQDIFKNAINYFLGNKHE